LDFKNGSERGIFYSEGLKVLGVFKGSNNTIIR